MSGCWCDRNQPMLTLGSPIQQSTVENLSALHCQWHSATQKILNNHLLKRKRRKKKKHLICWNWGYFDIERESCLLFQESYQFSLWLHYGRIPVSTVNYCRLLSPQAFNNEHCMFGSSTQKMNIFFVSWLFGLQGGVLVKITEACPLLNCSEKDHILPENQCCRVCRGKGAWQSGFGWRWVWGEVLMIAWL